MSQQNVESVRSVYEAVSSGDWDAAFEAVEPDFELVPPDQSPSSAPVGAWKRSEHPAPAGTDCAEVGWRAVLP